MEQPGAVIVSSVPSPSPLELNESLAEFLKTPVSKSTSSFTFFPMPSTPKTAKGSHGTKPRQSLQITITKTILTSSEAIIKLADEGREMELRVIPLIAHVQELQQQPKVQDADLVEAVTLVERLLKPMRQRFDQIQAMASQILELCQELHSLRSPLFPTAHGVLQTITALLGQVSASLQGVYTQAPRPDRWKCSLKGTLPTLKELCRQAALAISKDQPLVLVQ